MNDLDKKLWDIIDDQQYIGGNLNLSPESVAEGIAAIKQAFSDAEYCSFIKYPTDGTHRMTGQEWYDRYNTEKGFGSLDNLKDMPHSKDYSNGIDHAVIKCDEAAKRAAGLTE